MNNRAKSEDSVELVTEHPRLVPASGYRWVRGESGISKPRKSLFLVQNPWDGRPDTEVLLPSDLYLKLAELDINEESTLDFAAKFGSLGLRREHFHSVECSEKYGESSDTWGMEIGIFQSCYNIWRAIEDRDLKALKRMMTTGDGDLALKRSDKDLSKAARSHVVYQINSNLTARTIPPKQGCFKESCALNRNVTRPSYSRSVSYQLRTVETKGNGSTQIKGHLVPSCLLVSAWMQLAELAEGQRKIQQCVVCKKWMDVSETARPGSKHMHDRCSRAERMRRYRSKLNSTEL